MDIVSYPEALNPGLEGFVEDLDRLSWKYSLDTLVFGVEDAGEWEINLEETSLEELEDEIVSVLSETHLPPGDIADSSYFEATIVDEHNYEREPFEGIDLTETAVLRYELQGQNHEILATQGGPKYYTEDSKSIDEDIQQRMNFLN